MPIVIDRDIDIIYDHKLTKICFLQIIHAKQLFYYKTLSQADIALAYNNNTIKEIKNRYRENQEQIDFYIIQLIRNIKINEILKEDESRTRKSII